MILTENGVLKLMQRIKSFITSQLNTKASSVHTHSISEIDNLASQLGGGYTKSEVDTLLNGKSDTSHTHTKSQITDFPTIPTKTSDLTNDSGFISSAVKESSISNMSGWCLLHGNLLIQWGTQATNGGTSFTVNFSKPYSSKPIVTICYGQPDNKPTPCSVNSDTTVTTTSFVVYGPSNFAWRINWISIGKGA